MKKVLKFLLFVILLAVAALAGYFFIDTGEETHQPLDLVTPDFVFAIESDRPTGDWQDLSKTEVWQYLKGNEFFADLTDMADYLDSLLAANQQLVDLVRLGDMVVSAHMIKGGKDYDFAIMVDLKGKGRKVSKLKPVMIPLFESLDYEVSTDEYFNYDVYKLYDPNEKETLTLAVVKNIMVASYTENLVRDAIIQSEQSSVGEIPQFSQVRNRADRDELYTLYFNYDQVDEYMKIYTSEMPEELMDINQILTFSALDLDMTDEEIGLQGYVQQNDSFPSFLNVYKDIGVGRSHAPDVLPENTALYTSLGFDDFADFYQRFKAYYEKSDPEGFKTLNLTQTQMEKRLKIEFERDFFQWMTDEIITAVVPMDGQNKKYAYYALLHFDDPDLVEERLAHVMKRIGKTMVKFEEVDYQGFKIRYLKLKGFFSLFFKKMFSKIETPYFTYIDDYVVFSNDTTSLIHMIDTYLDQKILRENPDFAEFQDQFDNRFSVFTYIQTEEAYQYLQQSLDYETRKDLARNREYMLSFPQIGLELKPDGALYEAIFKAEFVHPETEPDS